MNRIRPFSRQRGRSPTELAFDRAFFTVFLFGAAFALLALGNGPSFAATIVVGLACLSWLRAFLSVIYSWGENGARWLRFSTCVLLLFGLLSSVLLLVASD